ncbi:hypothetical protein HK096_008067 [Nowakowskiella sp. JEL0078]|nr:hypothetical protein HK096_008067 [Nowakowskiella sp. JEL0078]
MEEENENVDWFPTDGVLSFTEYKKKADTSRIFVRSLTELKEPSPAYLKSTNKTSFQLPIKKTAAWNISRENNSELAETADHSAEISIVGGLQHSTPFFYRDFFVSDGSTMSTGFSHLSIPVDSTSNISSSPVSISSSMNFQQPESVVSIPLVSNEQPMSLSAATMAILAAALPARKQTLIEIEDVDPQYENSVAFEDGSKDVHTIEKSNSEVEIKKFSEFKNTAIPDAWKFSEFESEKGVSEELPTEFDLQKDFVIDLQVNEKVENHTENNENQLAIQDTSLEISKLSIAQNSQSSIASLFSDSKSPSSVSEKDRFPKSFYLLLTSN